MTGSGAVKGVTKPVADDAAAPPKRTRWVTAVTDRVPAKWIGGIATAAVLASTAAFGGLSAVAVAPLPELAVGEMFTGAQLQITVQRALVVDELADTGVKAGESQRLLVVILDATNIDDDPRGTQTSGSVSEIRIEGMPDAPPTVARLDDATLSPWLQPGVPAALVLTWAVPASAFAEGDDVRVSLHTATKLTGQYFVAGDYWADIVVAAHVNVAVEDLDQTEGG